MKKSNSIFNIKFLFLSSRQPMYELLEGWLRHKSDIVNFEAAKAICNIKNTTRKELNPAISGKFISKAYGTSFIYDIRLLMPIFFLAVSSSTIPVISKANTPLCGNSNIKQTSNDSASCCSAMQCGHGKSDHGSK